MVGKEVDEGDFPYRISGLEDWRFAIGELGVYGLEEIGWRDWEVI